MGSEIGIEYLVWGNLANQSFRINFFQMQRAAGLFNDPIHGSVEVNSLEKEIICTPEFSRLKDLKQLGT